MTYIEVKPPERTAMLMVDFQNKLAMGANTINSSICKDYRTLLNSFQSEIKDNRRMFFGKTRTTALQTYSMFGQILVSQGVANPMVDVQARKSELIGSGCLYQECKSHKCEDKGSFLGISKDKSNDLCVCDPRISKTKDPDIQTAALKYYISRLAHHKKEFLL